MSNSLVNSLDSFQKTHITLYLRAHEAHWNIVGEQFPYLHSFYKDIYESLYERIDPLSENIRKLGSFVIPYSSEKVNGLQNQLNTSPANTSFSLLSGFYAYLDELEGLLNRPEFKQGKYQGLLNFLAELQDNANFWVWQLKSTMEGNKDFTEEVN